MRWSHRSDRFMMPADRRAVAEQVRADRNRARFARLCRLTRAAGVPVFIDAVDRVRLAFASPSFIDQEIQWLKNYEEKNEQRK
jgi:hypothetical protein